jgi:arylsulfatase A-like enzyme
MPEAFRTILIQMPGRVFLMVALAAAACARPAPRARRDVDPSQAMSVAPGGMCPVPTASSARPAKAVARRVIIVSEDGMRPDLLGHAGTPVHDRLMREGSFTLKARTIRQASTLPAHAAMLSGFDVVEHGLYWNSWKPERGFIRVPTVFTAAGGAGHGSAAFVGKQKLAHITVPGSVDVFERPGYYCKKVAAEAASYFVEHRPQIEFVHFSDPDDRGHAKGWMSPEQVAAVAETDKCLGLLIDAVESAGLKEETLIIVSADHGGHGHGHVGYRNEQDRLIPWIAWGAGVRPSHRIEGTVNTFDTAATALWALGHPPPQGLLGRAIAEAFVREGDGLSKE